MAVLVEKQWNTRATLFWKLDKDQLRYNTMMEYLAEEPEMEVWRLKAMSSGSGDRNAGEIAGTRQRPLEISDAKRTCSRNGKTRSALLLDFITSATPPLVLWIHA